MWAFRWNILAIVIAIETQLGNGTMSLVHMVPIAWAPYVQAWAANLATIGMVIVAAFGMPVSLPPAAARALAIVAALAGLVLFGGGEARAADLVTKAPAAALQQDLGIGSPCTVKACSGFYVGFGMMGDGTNSAVTAGGVQSSVFSTGGILQVQGGYQFWNGQWFGALELGAGYEFQSGAPIAGSRDRFVGTELVKLGYGLSGLVATPTASPTASQGPSAITIPASLANALISPYLVFGGMQRHGINEWVNGAGAEFAIASGWSVDIKYLYAPAQQNQAATNLVGLALNRKF